MDSKEILFGVKIRITPPSVSWGQDTYNPTNMYSQSNTSRNSFLSPTSGASYDKRRLPSGGPRIPFGSQNSRGQFTGDFRGLGITNPWGGKSRKSKKTRKSRKSRKTRR